MGTTKRAFLYVTRKKGKSILLFFILLVMATFVLTGLSIAKSSQEAQRNLREALGGEFQMVVDLSDNNPYAKKTVDNEGNVELYTEYPITREIIDTVITINGIKNYSAETHTFVYTNLDIFPGNVPMKAEYNNLIYAWSVIDTQNNNFFQSEKFNLIEGNHITENEKNVAVISNALAEKNGLKLGDAISIQSDNTATVKIIGIYEILKPDPMYENIVTYEKAENQIFIDFQTLQNLFGNMPAGFESVTFDVFDPAQLDHIISDVKNLSSIDWRAFEVITNSETYLEAAAPLQKVQTLVTTMIIVIAIVSAIILSLVLTMWGRSRIHETGVFLSLGIAKVNIISQYLTEVLMIAVFAFGFSYVTSNTVANQLANGLLQQTTPAREEPTGIVTQLKDGYSSDGISISIKDGLALSDTPQQQKNNVDVEISAVETETEEAQIHTTVSIYNVLQLYIIGIAIIILSVGASSLTIMRLKPREILSKMS
ncbi:MAG: ABC transporter permease [Lachnospiraceae bacterium]|nr:ABC transporter permease [Lachnospiraceae bacterium]